MDLPIWVSAGTVAVTKIVTVAPAGKLLIVALILFVEPDTGEMLPQLVVHCQENGPVRSDGKTSLTATFEMGSLP
jgi:hypothetical protein